MGTHGEIDTGIVNRNLLAVYGFCTYFVLFPRMVKCLIIHFGKTSSELIVNFSKSLLLFSVDSKFNI